MTNRFTQTDYEILNKEMLYQGFFRLCRYTIKHRLYDGGWSETFTREVFERDPAIAILPYDPILDRVILIEQFRSGSLFDPENPWLIEIPAGILDKDEHAEDVAYREATEETGCRIQQLEPICEYYVSPGGSNEYLYLFCGKTDSRGIEGIHGLKEEHEDIRVINVSVEEAFAMAESGKIKTSPALITLFWLKLNRARLQKAW